MRGRIAWDSMVSERKIPMKHIDPNMAARVWQRVQASLDNPSQPCHKDERPIPRYKVPPEAWREPQKPARSACRQQPDGTASWIWLVLLWLLVS